ncbi:anti-sigma regulatory factor [Methanolobus mangrovi]|uniref:Anti-sigma regulatory factor n=1 Tax=Methanolobus mangrovi TaxID=3072977 RepID=A0AA51UE14_9EURY|nr:anti-sigma regulatory factor [Methanolobus mangrovi]WMW21494.1 anti-sigma regulatory factor [Methanolobus mangrovi]
MSEICEYTSPENGLKSMVEVTNLSHVANVQTTVRSIAKKLGFSELASHKAATSASELASNLVHHASNGGSITIREVRKDGYIGIEIVSNDSGPGIMDVDLALQDGYSTGNGLGSGLPAVKRIMDELDISVTGDSKTCITTRLWYLCE